MSSFQNTITGSSGADNLYGTALSDSMIGGNGNDTLVTSSGDDLLDAGNGNDRLDILWSGSGTSTLLGGAGDDTFNFWKSPAVVADGGDGNDLFLLAIDGPSAANGNPTLTGGAGVDTYQFSNIGGPYTITDFTAGPGGDKITLGSYVTAGFWSAIAQGKNLFDGVLRLVQDGADTKLQLLSGGYQTLLILQNVDKNSLTSDNFTEGLSPDGHNVGLKLVGADGGASLSGALFDDTLVGGKGNDTLAGLSGNDSLDGGAGNDVLYYGKGGNDVLRGGVGNDTLVALDEMGIDGLVFQVTLDGGAGDDTFRVQLTQGITDAVVIGGTGRDTYVLQNQDADDLAYHVTDFTAGAGGDQIDMSALMGPLYNYNGGSPFYANGGFEIVQVGANVEIRAPLFNVVGAKTVLILDNVSADSLTSANFVNQLDPHGGGVPGVALTAGVGNVKLEGGNFNDTLTGGNGADTLLGGGGDDLLRSAVKSGQITGDSLDGGNGNDTLVGSNGNDILNDDTGSNSLDGGAGDDVLRAGGINGMGSGANTLLGGDGNDTLTGSGSGYYVMDGGNGNDVLIHGGGVGGVMRGGAGNDEFRLGPVYQGDGAADQITIDGGAGDDVVNFVSEDFHVGAYQVVAAGGAGRDIYRINPVSSAGIDLHVTDFQAGPGGDRIDLGYVGHYLSDGYVRLLQDGANTLVQYRNLDNHTDFVTILTLDNLDASKIDGDNFYTAPGSAGPGNDVLTGNPYDDVMDGGGGADTMSGGAGDDVYYVDNGKDVVVENSNQGSDTVISTAASYTLAANVENLILKGAGLKGIGNALDNLLVADAAGSDLQGGAGNDTFQGHGGADTLAGGAGNDLYYVSNTQTTIKELAGEGIDKVITGIDGYVLADNIENLELTDGAHSATGNAQNNVITGFNSYNIYANTVVLHGGAGNDSLVGTNGDDTLDGGTGNDTLVGGGGSDVFVVDSIGDVLVVPTLAAGYTIGKIETTLATYQMPVWAASLSYTGSAGFTGTGNAYNNNIHGGTGADRLAGGGGADSLYGGAGNDTLQGGDGDDLLDAGTGVDVIDGGSGQDTLILAGNYADYVRTRPGAETSHLVNQLTGEDVTFTNIETVIFKDLTSQFWSADTGKPTQFDDYLGGTSGNDTLNGGLGADTMVGGLGDDHYVVDNIKDVIREEYFAGKDSVDVALTATATYELPTYVENATVTSATAAISLKGNSENNLLVGNAAANALWGMDGDDTLAGGSGADTLIGGAGDDVYVVSDARAVVVELEAGGFDTVETNLASYTLGANLERVRYTGTAAFSATGNALDNVLVGGNGGNKLDGGAGNDYLYGGNGADSLTGGLGNDTFIGAIGKDTIDGGAGADLLDGLGAFGDYHFARPNAIDMVLTDKAGNVITTRGVEFFNFSDGSKELSDLQYNIASVDNDKLSGTDGNDSINGGAGLDSMAGGKGDDIYVIDNVGDVVIELADQGTDLVQVGLTAAGSYTLGDNVENGTVTAAATVAVNLAGNTLDNWLIGNAAANTLSGDAGNDTLDGAAGADKLIGGLGDDVYVIDNAGDQVTELLNEGTDTVQTSLASYTLTANVEKLFYTGTAAFAGTGNALDNTIVAGDGPLGAKLDGGAGNDTLVGGKGSDSLQGGLGDDAIVASAGKDTVDGGAGSDTLQGLDIYAHYTFSRPNATDTVLTDSLGNVTTVRNVENFVFADGAKTLAQLQDNLASPGNDSLHGTPGKDTLDGGLGVDTLAGGDGNDVYVISNTATVILENADEGVDQVNLAVAGTYVLTANVENATVTAAASIAASLTGNALDNLLTGNAAANTLVGGAGDDTLDGGAGADKLIGGLGNDVYLVDNSGDSIIEAVGEGSDTVRTALASYTLGANLENLQYTGTAAFTGTGNALNNTIVAGNGLLGVKFDGGAGNDTLVGGKSSDSLQGGLGDDVFVGSAGKDTVDGGAGSDTLQGLDLFGHYTIARPNATDTVLTDSLGNVTTVRNVESFVFADGVKTLAEVQLNIVSDGNDNLQGGAGNDVLNGGLGADTMAGGAGDDVYIVDNLADVVVEQANAGRDVVNLALKAAGTYVLADNVEVAGMTTAVAINITGNALDNLLMGNAAVNILLGGAGNDTLDGGAGADKLTGGLGDDTYIVDNAADVVTEALGEGTDTVQTTLATYALGANLEKLVYTGTGVFTGTGNALDNVLEAYGSGARLDGGIGNDTLISGFGNDSLSGGAGDDVIELKAGKDSVDGGAGSDTLIALLHQFRDYTVQRTATDTVLTAANGDVITVRNVEHFQFADGDYTLEQVQDNSASANNDVLLGSSDADTLDGGLGNDTLIGGDGSDTYVLDNPNDVVQEADGGGMFDTVRLAFSKTGTYTMAANVENAVVTAAASVAVHVVGNELDNVITGNAAGNSLSGGAGNDQLDGGAGNDTMMGGTGDDTYVVSEAGDVVTEKAGEGMDVVRTTLASYKLTDNVEQLIYTGSSTFSGTGNAQDNGLYAESSKSATLDGGAGDDYLQGGAGNDSLIGGVGDDILVGGAGSDKLTGGAGADTFMLTSTNGVDTVADFVAGTDRITLNMAGLAIGNGDETVDGALVRTAPGGFAADAELVVFTQRMTTASAANAAAVIGSASSSYHSGDTALFAVSTSSATTLYRFVSSGDDAQVSAAELTQLAVLTGAPAINLTDIHFTV